MISLSHKKIPHEIIAATDSSKMLPILSESTRFRVFFAPILLKKPLFFA